MWSRHKDSLQDLAFKGGMKQEDMTVVNRLGLELRELSERMHQSSSSSAAESRSDAEEMEIEEGAGDESVSIGVDEGPRVGGGRKRKTDREDGGCQVQAGGALMKEGVKTINDLPYVALLRVVEILGTPPQDRSVSLATRSHEQEGRAFLSDLTSMRGVCHRWKGMVDGSSIICYQVCECRWPWWKTAGELRANILIVIANKTIGVTRKRAE